MERPPQRPKGDAPPASSSSSRHFDSSSKRKMSEKEQQRRREDYKKKKLENRKNHLKKILEKQDAGRRAFSLKDSEFVGALQFRNV